MFLNSHTYYSLRYGVLSPSELVNYAVEAGLDYVVLTDINNTSCTFDFFRECENAGIKAIAGIEFRQDNELKFIGIARNNHGFYELNELLSECSLKDLEIPDTAPDLEDCYIIYPFEQERKYSLKSYEFIGIRPAQVSKLIGSPWAKNIEKLLPLNPVTLRDEDDYLTHKLLQAIDQNSLLSRLDSTHIASASEVFHSEEKVKNWYNLFPELVINSRKIIDDCSISFELKNMRNKKYFTGSAEEDRIELYHLAEEGFTYRYGENKVARERLDNELKVIHELGFSAYFLITLDIIKYAASKGYHHVGRGSGANSIAAYCLKITDVDPIELDLYFERFINSNRTSPPDFDIDFSWTDRNDITEYIFQKYKKNYVALLATYTTFRDRSIIREIAKVYGLPKEAIDTLIKNPDPAQHHYLAKQIFKLGSRIEDFPNYLSIHAGGILISEEPLTTCTALQMMPKGFPIVQFDMYVAEDIGYYKYDILSQRGLGHLRDGVQIVAENCGIRIDIHQAHKFMKDPKICSQLKTAETIGCFYIESPAMRGLLSKLQCDNYLCLVAASSIIRPGVAQSGMMRDYIYYHHHPDKVKYLHPKFKELLAETYGVMVYQEDVMKIAHHFGGLSLEQADILRRAMSGKSRGPNGFKRFRDQFFDNCRKKGYPDELTAEAWRQMESFSGYSFCKAHSASYAVESFQSLYLKTYFPREFMVAVVNNFGGFYNAELYLHEARIAGAVIEAPCINNSRYFTCIKEKTIYLGFIHLKGLENELGKNIEYERNRNGQFKSFEDFMNRVSVGKEQLNILIRINAFRYTQQKREHLLWQKNDFLNREPYLQTMPIKELLADTETAALPELEVYPNEEVFEQIELLGFPLVSPFDLLKTKFRADISFDEFNKHVGKIVKLVGYYIDRKTVRTKNSDTMYFGFWIDHKGNYFDTVHFPPSLIQYPFYGKGLYLLMGKIVDDFGYCSLEIMKMAKLPTVSADTPK